MSDIVSFKNESIPGIKTQITVINSNKNTVFIRDEMKGEKLSMVVLDHQTALDVAKWILENVEVTE